MTFLQIRGNALVLIALAGLLGCGAKAVDDPNADPQAEEVQQSKDQAAQGETPTTQQGSEVQTSGGFATRQLPPCVEGPLYDGQRCPFLAGERCYEQQIEACACICPRDRRAPRCSSGFPSESGYPPADVICNAD